MPTQSRETVQGTGSGTRPTMTEYDLWLQSDRTADGPNGKSFCENRRGTLLSHWLPLRECMAPTTFSGVLNPVAALESIKAETARTGVEMTQDAATGDESSEVVSSPPPLFLGVPMSGLSAGFELPDDDY